MKKVGLWHLEPDGRLQCELCPRACRLKDGQAGFCYIRQRQGDTMVLTSYGRSSGFCIDPIEKKPLHHFLPGTPVLSFGTAGCNLGCVFCQNWDISKARHLDRLQDRAAPDEIVRAAMEHGCRSIAYTYNDPVIFLEYAIDTAIAAREHGIKSIAVTAGYIHGEARKLFFRHMHAANIDLKSFSDDFYRRNCKASLQPVLDTLRYVAGETTCWMELTTLLIPGENDSDEEISAMTSWVVRELGPDVPMHFTAFHPDFQMGDLEQTPAHTLRRARKIAQGNGVHYAYTGNIRDAAGASTHCSACGALLIGRDLFQISEWNLGDMAACKACGITCPGVFDASPGTWGSRRQPVRISPRPGAGPE